MDLTLNSTEPGRVTLTHDEAMQIVSHFQQLKNALKTEQNSAQELAAECIKLTSARDEALVAWACVDEADAGLDRLARAVGNLVNTRNRLLGINVRMKTT